MTNPLTKRKTLEDSSDQAQDPRGFFSDALTDQSAESLLEQLKVTMKNIKDVEIIECPSLNVYNDKASPECVDYLRRWEDVAKRMLKLGVILTNISAWNSPYTNGFSGHTEERDRPPRTGRQCRGRKILRPASSYPRGL